MFDKLLEVALSVFKKAICIFDDIPFLLKGIGVLTGLFTLIGAGYLIFGVQLYNATTELKEAYNKKEDDESRTASIITSGFQVAFAVMGLVLTTGLLVLTAVGLLFTLKALLVIASALSAIVPLIMAAVAGIELLQSIDEWTYAKDAESAEEAKTNIIYNVLYFGLAIAVTALAAVTVILGPGIPTFTLIGVIGVSVALKLYQEREAIWNALVTMANAIEEKINEFVDYVKIKCNGLCCCFRREPMQDIAITSTRARLNNSELSKSSSGESLADLRNSNSEISSETEPVKETVKEPVTPIIEIQVSQQPLNDNEFRDPVFSYTK